jgi:hypothetical protein
MDGEFYMSKPEVETLTDSFIFFEALGAYHYYARKGSSESPREVLPSGLSWEVES